MDIITEKAYAKLNISLDVTDRRSDGFHDMVMVMQTVSLCDEIRITPVSGGRVTAKCDLPFIPGDERNLAVRAALCFLEALGTAGQGLHIEVMKHIPVGAGMGGGSSDAAAVLRGLNRMYGMPFGVGELETLACQVGSDVPFCVAGGTALAKGRGEKLTPLRPLPPCRFVICKPEFSISTPELFRKLDRVNLRNHPDTAGLLLALERGELGGLCRRMYNVFEDVEDRRLRVVSEIKGILLDHGALGAVMTGTGSSTFGVFEPGRELAGVCGALKESYGFCVEAEAVDRLCAD